MAQDSKSRKLDQYIVRFPDGMRDALKHEASRNNRSLNAEIVERLANSLFDPRPSDVENQIGEIRGMILQLQDYIKAGRVPLDGSIAGGILEIGRTKD